MSMQRQSTSKYAKKNQAARQKRGFASADFTAQLIGLSDEQLIILCAGMDVQKRTASAKLLGTRQCEKAVPILCERLKNEHALYPRIAVSEALGAIGVCALPSLIMLLGQIGNNQHRSLPERGFNKKSFPLPRDIAARTIVKMGAPALPALEKVIINGERRQILEAMDCIGHIAFYCHNLCSLPVLLAAIVHHKDDDLVKWKIVRALQSFPNHEVKQILNNIICTSCVPALRLEAVRSLGQMLKTT